MRKFRGLLGDMRQLPLPRRFRRGSQGNVQAGGPEVTGAGSGSGPLVDRPAGNGTRRRGAGGRGIGAVLSELEDPGAPATEIVSARNLEPLWVTEEQADTTTIVHGKANGLHEIGRAAC